MAYARSTSKFPDLKDGQFYYSGPDAEGKVLAGFGRYRDKWIEFRQHELLAILENAHTLIVTDDPAVKKALTDLAGMLHKAVPVTFEDVLNDPDGLGRRYFGIVQAGGKSREEALAQLTAERDAKPAPKPRLKSA